jgi:hypothetical protein
VQVGRIDPARRAGILLRARAEAAVAAAGSWPTLLVEAGVARHWLDRASAAGSTGSVRRSLPARHGKPDEPAALAKK